MHQFIPQSDRLWLANFHQCVEEQLHRADLTTDDLAKSMYYSTRQLCRRVKHFTGQTPKAILKKARLEKGYYYLKKGKYATVARAANAVGFKDPVYFARQFQAEYGILPSKI